jgi:hypothetical protein
LPFTCKARSRKYVEIIGEWLIWWDAMQSGKYFTTAEKR